MLPSAYASDSKGARQSADTDEWHRDIRGAVPVRFGPNGVREVHATAGTEAAWLRGRNNMSNAYAAVSALIFTVVAIMHVLRVINRWTVAIGPYNVPMNVSWAALVVSALLAIWGFMQLS